MTYSILARDETTGQFGVAVQSHFLGVGRLAPYIEAGLGAVVTQAFVAPWYGPKGLALLREGATAAEVLRGLLDDDPDAAIRQAAVVDARGDVAAHTGGACYLEAGHATGPGVSVQGNMLSATGTPEAMLAAFAAGEGDLAGRLLAALDAAEVHGGDSRGVQSAALLVAAGDAERGVLVDCRVDDATDPLAELRRLVDLSRAYDELGVLFIPGMVTGTSGPSPTDADTALAALERAVALLPGSVEPLLWQAVVAARAGRAAEAREAAQRAIAAQPRIGPFLARLKTQGVIPEATWLPS